MIYAKPVLPIKALYEKLIDRRLEVPQEDKQAVYQALLRVGYYRLTGYCLPFIQKTGDQRKVFINGTTIHSILALYDFDANLRRLALQALGEIEIALVASICDTMCVRHSATWYDTPEIFASPDAYEKVRGEAAKHLKFDLVTGKGLAKNPNLFLKHYYSTYDDPKLPPAWMLRECATFGFWSHTYESLKPKEKSAIAELWKYPNKKLIHSTVFESWLRTLTVFRNRCAHHNRITNTTLPYDPKTPDNAPAAARFGKCTNDLRTFLLVIDILMRNVSPHSTWKNMLFNEFTTAAKKNVAVSNATGFSTQWENDEFWLDWTPPTKLGVAAKAA